MTTTARSRRTFRTAGLVGACTLAFLALTGCLKVDADLTIDSDAKASGTFALELQKEAASFLGINDLDSFKTQVDSGDLSGDSGLAALGTCEPSMSDTGFVYSCSFTDTAFTNPDDGPWTITKDGTSIVFAMANQGQTDEQAAQSADLLGDASLGTITVNVTFPGPITAITGAGAEKTSDTTATISGSLTDTMDVTITSDASSGGLTASVILVILVAIAIVLLIVVVVIVMLSRRRKGLDAPDGDVVGDLAAPAAAAAGAVVVTESVTESVTETLTPTTETVAETEAVTETLAPTTEVVEQADTVTEAVEDAEPVVDTPAETSAEVPAEPTPDAAPESDTPNA